MKLVLEIFGLEVLKVFKNDWEKCLAKLNFGHGKFGHDLVHGPMRFLPWAVHFESLYLSIGWSDEKTFNIKVVEEVAINKSHVEHFFIWSLHHGVIGSGTLEKHAHQVFVEKTACWHALALPGWPKMPCNVSTLIDHISLNFNPNEEFLLWFWSWIYELSNGPGRFLNWGFILKKASSKVGPPNCQNLP